MTQALKKEYIQRQKQTIYIFVSLLYHFQNVVMCTMWIMKLQISTSFVLSLTQFCLRPIRWRYRCTLNGQVFPWTFSHQHMYWTHTYNKIPSTAILIRPGLDSSPSIQNSRKLDSCFYRAQDPRSYTFRRKGSKLYVYLSLLRIYLLYHLVCIFYNKDSFSCAALKY